MGLMRAGVTVTVLVVLGALWASVGCSSTTTFGPGLADAAIDGANGNGYAEALSTIYDAQCDYIGRCSKSLLAQIYGGVDACKKRNRDLVVQGAPGLTLSQAQADACAAEFAALECIIDRVLYPPKCQVKGTLEDGASCDLNGQCASGSCYHANPDSAECGVCQAEVPLGGDCAAGDCAWGLFCAGTTCVKKVTEGEACNTRDKRCLGQLDCVQGKCAVPLQENAPCGATGTPQCDVLKDLFCVPTAPPDAVGTCKSFLYAKVGEACGGDSKVGTFTVCSSGTCLPSEAKGTCVAYAEDGADCTSASCRPPAQCLDKKCRLRDPATCK